MNLLLALCFFAALVAVIAFIAYLIRTEREIDRRMERAISRLREIEQSDRGVIMGDWTGFLVGLWEGRMDAHEEVETSTMRRITEALRSHYDEYGAWPEKIRVRRELVDELNRETRELNTIPGFRHWPIAGMEKATLFDVPVEWVGLKKRAEPKGVLELRPQSEVEFP